MSIGSLTVWNFGDKFRSRDYQYLLHCLSVSEKDRITEDIWRQHTDEMLMLEGNLFNVCGKQEFQPSADQPWQSWASELCQAGSYPLPYANVHKWLGIHGCNNWACWHWHMESTHNGKAKAGFKKAGVENLSPISSSYWEEEAWERIGFHSLKWHKANSALFNKEQFDVVCKVKEVCSLYFNRLSLFFCLLRASAVASSKCK